MKNFILLLSIIVFSLLFSCEDEKIINPKPDVVNYDTVKICNQVWMSKNLDVDHYRNGDSIPEVRDSATWANLKTGAWCYYNNDTAMGAIYGKLYNWYAVNDPRGLAPEGWHVPADDEWKQLEMCLGMTQSDADETGYRGTDQGSQLAGRSDLWKDDDLNRNPKFGKSGFSALPGGWRSYDWTFKHIDDGGFWWSSTETFHRYLYYYITSIYRSDHLKESGFSVRCVRDY